MIHRSDIDEAFQIYLKEIGRLKPLPSEEECALATRIQKGDSKAKDKLIKHNLRFVVNVATNYSNQGMSLSDLVAEGNKGLVRAAGRFDGSKNFKFISYAVWWVRQAILCALADQSRTCRIPGNKVAELYKLGKCKNSMYGKVMREPSLEELANDAEMTLEKVRDLTQLSLPQVSLDAPTGESITLQDTLYSEDRADEVAEGNMLQKSIRGMLNNLSPRSREVLEMFFGFRGGLPMTLDEIGQYYGISRERARQIRNSALDKLKELREVNKELRNYIHV